ncbi:MAG: hypothetical protein ACP5I1_13865, partial [Candidatus Hinthialibacter sp.]
MSRKKLIMHSFVFLLVCVFSLNAQCQINPIFIINAKNIKYEGTYRISYLNCNSNILDIQFTRFYWYGDFTYAKYEYNIYDTFLIHYDLRNNVFGEKENCKDFLYSNEERIKEASSVIIDNQYVFLEDSYIPTI